MSMTRSQGRRFFELVLHSLKIIAAHDVRALDSFRSLSVVIFMSCLGILEKSCLTRKKALQENGS